MKPPPHVRKDIKEKEKYKKRRKRRVYGRK
jgi:hypothetical protein